MSEERATLEKIAPSVEEAVADALSELGLSEDDVDIEILDEGSKGLLGIGGRQARVRLTIKGEGGEMSKPASQPASRTAASGEDMDVDNLLSISEATVNELLDRMGVAANVTARTAEDIHPDGTPNVVVDITGDDLSILIGRKAETLNALQFITRLIVGKEMGQAAHLSIDVEGYRSRRERSLEQLAQRMATQAVKTGRRQTLEPMPPNERRIIHIALRDNEDVSTESVGEEPRRKVMIIPNE